MAPPKENKPPAGPKVSPARTIVSLLLLLVVGVVCAIELRAGLGQYLTGRAFTAKCNKEGEFENIKLSEAKSLVSMFPSETVHRKSESDVVLKYEWFSLLRPLMGESSPKMYLIAGGGSDPIALAFHTEADDDVPVPVPSAGDGPPPGMGAGGMGMMPGGPGGGPPGIGGPGGGRGAGGKDRPALEGDPETPATDGTATPATDTPATDAPATDAPATDAPATDAPAGSEPDSKPPN